MSDLSADALASIAQLEPARSTRATPAARCQSVDSRVAIWEKLGWLLMAALLVIGLPMAYRRAVDGGPDLAGFCDAGRYVLEHGTRDPESTLARYWPSADVPWIAFSLFPISVVAVVWYCLNCAAWLGLLHTIYHRLLGGRTSSRVGWTSESVSRVATDLESPSYESRTIRRHATLAAGLLAMPLVLDGMAMGSFHVLMVWLMILGLDRACRGQATRGGLLLGLGAWLKLLPLLGIGFLVYHRKWKAAVIATATVALLDIALSVAAFGPAGAWREHVLWWQAGAKGTTERQLARDRPVDEDRLTNQSVAVTLRRLLTSLGTGISGAVRLPPSSGPHAAARDAVPDSLSPHELSIDARARRHVQLAELSPGQLHVAFLSIMGLFALAVAIYCRPVAAAAWPAQGPRKIVMMVLATLWFSPVTWSYHFVAAAPAVATLLLRARYRLAWVVPVLFVWCLSLTLLASDTCRAAGVLLWMSVLIGAGMVVYPAARPTAAETP